MLPGQGIAIAAESRSPGYSGLKSCPGSLFRRLPGDVQPRMRRMVGHHEVLIRLAGIFPELRQRDEFELRVLAIEANVVRQRRGREFRTFQNILGKLAKAISGRPGGNGQEADLAGGAIGIVRGEGRRGLAERLVDQGLRGTIGAVAEEDLGRVRVIEFGIEELTRAVEEELRGSAGPFPAA